MPQLTVALTSEASTWAMLMLGVGGFGFAAFSMGMKVGQIVEAAWWKGKLQEALTSTREPPPSRQMSLVRERPELGENPLRRDSLLRRRSPRGLQARSLNERLKNDPFQLKRLLPKVLRVEPRKCRRSPDSQWGAPQRRPRFRYSG